MTGLVVNKQTNMLLGKNRKERGWTKNKVGINTNFQ